jgi:hypothetical protein
MIFSPLSLFSSYSFIRQVAQFLVKKQAQAAKSRSEAQRVLWSSMMVLDQPDVPQLYAAAAANDVLGVVRCIVLFGTDVDSVTNDKTPLMVAAANGAAGAAEALLRLKARVNYVDRDGVTALIIACANGASSE